MVLIWAGASTGGGNAGISVAARLARAGERDIAVIDPSTTHYYQPLWTLVGGGRSTIEKSAREQADVMPKGVTWVQQKAADIDPYGKTVSLANGDTGRLRLPRRLPRHPARLAESPRSV